MKQTVNKSIFIDQFRVMDRLDNFSYEARELLFDHLEELEQDTNEEIEMDVIAVCCDYSEESSEDIASNYNIDISDCDGDDEIHDAIIEYLNDNTFVVGETPSGIVYQVF